MAGGYRYHQSMAGEEAEGLDGGGGEGEVAWSELNRSFSRVQSVLDRNRVLIQQVNDNHQSRMPENMARNVPLIRELNGNISKVVSMYSDLSTNFSSVVHDRRHPTPSRPANGRPAGGRRGRDDA